MKLTIDKQNIDSILKKVDKTVDIGGDFLEVTSGVLMEAKEGELQVSGANAENFASIRTDDVKIEEEGAALPRYKLLKSLLKAFPDGDLMLDTREDCMLLTQGQKEYKVPVHRNLQDFPVPPAIKTPASEIEVMQDEMKKIVNIMLTCSSTNEERASLNGMYIDIGETTNFVATDTNRLGVYYYNANGNYSPGEYKSCILSNNTLKYLKSVLGDEGSVRFEIGESNVCIEMDDLKIVARQISGTYPEYESLIPDIDSGVRFNRREMEQAARRAMAVNKYHGSIKLYAEFKPEEIELRADGEQGHESIPANVDGGPEKIIFHTRYLLDFLKLADVDEVDVLMGSGMEPAVFNGNSFVYALAPIQE